jgi:fluoride ion exporter CrcB/FEX
VRLVEDGSWVEALLNVTASMLMGLLAVAAGWLVVDLLW